MIIELIEVVVGVVVACLCVTFGLTGAGCEDKKRMTNLEDSGVPSSGGVGPGDD